MEHLSVRIDTVPSKRIKGGLLFFSFEPADVFINQVNLPLTFFLSAVLKGEKSDAVFQICLVTFILYNVSVLDWKLL